MILLYHFPVTKTDRAKLNFLIGNGIFWTAVERFL